jgi:CheY-like chemotaxis protein
VPAVLLKAMPKLVVTNKTLTVMAHELGDKWVTIGRHDGNTFQIVEASISGRHCEVRLRGEELVVRDLLSSNGTFVDDKKIIEGVLKPGQTLRLGDVEMKLEASIPTEASGTGFNSKMLLTTKKTAAASPDTAAKSAPVTENKPVSPALNGESHAKKFQVLFVDDSLGFLEMFTEMCSVLSDQTWQIHTAASADRALAILQQHPIDLVVLDIVMPLVDGLQLLGIIGRRYSSLKIVVMTAKANDGNRAACLSGGAELFIEKPVSPDGIKMVFNMLNDLVSWTRREGFSGALRQVGLEEVIQMECNARHSSILEIRNEQMLGKIYIEAGVITHAAVGALVGEKAFNKLLSLKGGEFHLKPFKAPPQRTLHGNWEVLLLEAARNSDEETGLITKKSVVEAAKMSAPAPVPEEKLAALCDDIVVVATYDGGWKPVDETK